MKQNFTAAGLLLAFAAVAGIPPENFDRPAADPAEAVRWSSAAPAKFQNSGGLDDSACAVLTYNGQALVRRFPIQPGVCDFSYTAAVKLNSNVSFCGIEFGAEKIAWNHYQGGIQLKVGQPPAPGLPPIEAGRWYNVRLTLHQNPAGGGYDFFLDGEPVFRCRKMGADARLPIQSIRIGYYDSKNDGPILVDDVAFLPSEPTKIETGWSDDFKSYRNDAELGCAFRSASPAILAPAGGEALLFYNGQALEKHFSPLPFDREWVFGATVRPESGKSFCRISFGTEKIAWNRFQGFHDLYPDDGKAHRVEFTIRANPLKGGRYDVRVDGREIVRDKPFEGNAGEAVSSIRVCYLSTKADGPIRVEQLSVRPGAELRLPAAERVAVKFPPEATARTFRGGRILLPFELTGQTDGLSNLQGKLFPNHYNQHVQAEKEALRIASAVPDAAGKGELAFDDVPFGMFTLRLYADTPEGKEQLIREEFVSMVHPAPKAPQTMPIRWGITTHGDRFDRRLDLEIPPLREAGANWTRFEIALYELTDAEGNINFAHHDKLFEEGRRNGVNFFAVINTKPQGSGISPNSKWFSQPDVKSWEKALRQVFTHYKGKIDYYEIWNEPLHYEWNGFEPGVERAVQYAELFKAARRVADEVSPGVKLMGPCMTGNMIPYLRTVAKAGGLDKADLISVHGRPFPDYKDECYQAILREITGRELPVFCTEGANDSRALIASFAGETPAAGFVYTMRDKGVNPVNYEHNNGMIKYDGLPKGRFIQYQFLSTMLGNAEYIGKIFSDRGLNGYLFREDGIWTAAVWAGESTELPRPAGAACFDALGNPFGDGRLTAFIPGSEENFEPKKIAFIRGLAPESPEVVAALVNCNMEYKLLPTNESLKLRFTFFNPGGRPRTYGLRLADTPHLKFAGLAPVTVGPGETVERELAFQAAPDTPVSELRIAATLETDGRKLPRVFGPFRFVNPERFKQSPVLDFTEKVNLEVSAKAEDLHATQSTGVARKKQDQASLSRGSSVGAASVDGKTCARLDYRFHRPPGGWAHTWLASSYQLRKPVQLPGIPVKLKMKLFMENNVENYPVTLVFFFKDPTGKTIRVEAGEVFWTGWREYEVDIPSLLSGGHIHSVAGGNKLPKIDTWPLTLTGFSINLIPLSSSIHAENPDHVAGYLLLDRIDVESYQ